MRKRLLIVGAILVASAASMATVACTQGLLGGVTGTEAIGGGGADFDASLYYTKTELYNKGQIDQMFYDKATMYWTPNPNVQTHSLTGVGFANGAGDFEAPAFGNGMAGVFIVRAQNVNADQTSATLNLYVSGSATGEAIEFLRTTLHYQDQITYNVICPFHFFTEPTPSTVRIWQDNAGTFLPLTSIGSGVSVEITCRGWMKGQP